MVAMLMMVPRVLSVDFVDQGSGGGGGEDISKLVVTSSSSFLFFSLQANVFSGDIYKENNCCGNVKLENDVFDQHSATAFETFFSLGAKKLTRVVSEFAVQ